MPEDSKTKDMKLKIKSPLILADDYNTYAALIKKSFKQPEKLAGTEFVFIADFKFNEENVGEHPILFLGTLNSEWKQAIRQSYKKKSTFVYGVCAVAEDASGNPHGVLKLQYKGGKGAKDKNIKQFKKNHKKYFSDVVFEQFLDENGQADNLGKNLLQEEEQLLGAANNEEYLAMIKSFRSLQHHIKTLRAKPNRELMAQVGEEIEILQDRIDTWKNEASVQSEEEQSTINNIEIYLAKVAQQVKSKKKAKKAGMVEDVYVITSELISIQGDIGEIRMYNADKSGIDIRKELTIHIINKANKWEELYGDDTEGIIYQEEQEKIQKYKAYALNIQGQLEARDTILDFRELRDDLQDLKTRAAEAEGNKAKVIRLWLQELYTIQQQLEHWGANNPSILTHNDASSKEGKIKVNYEAYTQSGGEIDQFRAELMEHLKNQVGEKFNSGQEEAQIVKAATGYSAEELIQLQDLGTFDKNLLKKVEDKNLKNSLEKLRNKLKKVEDSNAEEKRFLLWQIKLEIERHLKKHPTNTALDDIQQKVEEKIKGIAQIEADNDVYEAFLEKHSTFETAREALAPLQAILIDVKTVKQQLRVHKTALEGASTDEEKQQIEEDINLANDQLDTLNNQLKASNLDSVFENLGAVLDEMSELVLSWDSKYQKSKHYDTVEKGKEIHHHHREAFLFFRNQSTTFKKFFEAGEDFLELRGHLEGKTDFSMKEYQKKDAAYNSLIYHHYNIHTEHPSISTKDRMEAAALGSPIHIGLYDSKALKKVHHDTNVWLFEAHNLYYESPLLTSRIKRIEDYKKRLLPLMNYIPIKAKHFELKYQEKSALAVVKGIDNTNAFFEDALHLLQSANTKEEGESAVMSVLLELGFSKAGMGAEHFINHAVLNKYTQQYNREVLHSKKMPDLGDFEQDPTPYKDYYSNLLTYIKEDVRKMEVQKIQDTLGQMEQNNLHYKKSQQQFLDEELERLAQSSNHKTEKQLWNLFTSIKNQLTSKDRYTATLKNEIDQQQEQLNLLKIGQLDSFTQEGEEERTEEEWDRLKEAVKEELETLKNKLITHKEELLQTKKQLEEFYDNIIEVFSGNTTASFWDPLETLSNSLPLATEIAALRAAVEEEEEAAGMDIGKIVLVLNKYIIKHKESLKELVKYDLTDLDLKANQKVVDKLYGNQDTYKRKLDQFIQDKTALHQQLKTIVSKNSIEELAALPTETLQEAFQVIRDWDILTMPIIGPDAKLHLKTIQQQKADFAKYKFRLEQAMASKGEGSRKLQEVYQYYQAILTINKQLKGSVEDLVKEDDLKGRIKTLDNKFQYYQQLLNDAIEQAYPGIEAETYLVNMYWDNTIKRLALKIQAFKGHSSFLEANKEEWQQEKIDFLEEYSQNSTDLDINFSIDSFQTAIQQFDLSTAASIQELEIYWNSLLQQSQEEEIAAILAKKEEFQQDLHDQLFMYRGVSHEDTSLQKEGLDGAIQDKVNLVCARAKRLLELGEEAAAKALVRNIPATFLDTDFVAAKRIFDNINAILQNEDRPMESSTGTGQLLVDSVGLTKTLLEATQLDAFAKLTRENPEVIKKWGEYVEEGELSISFDGKEYHLEPTDKASDEAKEFLTGNKEQLTGQAEEGNKVAGTAAILSTVATGIQLGLDAKGIIDGFLAMNQARKSGDMLTEEKYANIVACNILSTIPSLINKATSVYNTFDSLTKGEGLGDILAKGGGPEGKIITASLKLVSSLFARSKAQLEAGLEANRKDYWKNTANNLLDITSDVISLVDGGVNAVLEIFEANIPGLSMAADVVSIMKDVKNIVEKEAVYREKKRTAHYMKLLQQAGDQDGSDYTDALKGIRKDSKRQRQAAGVDLASAGVDAGLNVVKLSGDTLTATGVLAPVGEAISIGVQITQALKTTGLFSYSLFLEYKKSNRHKKVKQLLIEAKAKNYDALAEIQSKSVHYAQAFLITGVIEAAKEKDGTVHLRNDNMSAAYIEHLGLDLNQKTAQEVIDAHVGMLDIGMMTHRFERYHNDFKGTWGSDPASKIKEQLNHFQQADELRAANLDTTAVASSVEAFLKAMTTAIKAYNEVKIYKANHDYINFVDKKIGKKGSLTKVTEEQKTLLQAASSLIKETMLPNIQEVLDELIQAEEDTAFEKFQFLQEQEAKLENFLTKIPQKALLN